MITEHITPLDEGKPIEERKGMAQLNARQVIAVSNALGRDLKRVYGVDSVTIPNIVDLSAFAYDPLSRPSSEPENAPHNASITDTHAEKTKSGACFGKNKMIRILSAASMNHGKGFDILIHAYASLLKSHPDCHLTIMGDGPEMPAIRSLAREYGIREKHMHRNRISLTIRCQRQKHPELCLLQVHIHMSVPTSPASSVGVTSLSCPAARRPLALYMPRHWRQVCL